MHFYTNYSLDGNKVLFRGYADGNRVQQPIRYRPSLFIPTNGSTKYRTMNGVKVERKQFNTISDARAFYNQYKDVDSYKIYGSRRFENACIADLFPTIEYDFNAIKILYFDIETTCEEGFPNEENPVEEINVITFELNNKYYVFGCGNYTPTSPNIYYFKCNSEEELLMKFFEQFRECDPDIVSGWNSSLFDWPYLVARSARLLGAGVIDCLSPWNRMKHRTMFLRGREYNVYDFDGISSLDYLEVYQKFCLEPRDNYKLDNIAQVELKQGKLDYSHDYSFRSLYQNNYQLFVEYNIKDVELIKKIEQKRRYIQMIVATAYDARVNYIDVFRQVRLWENIIFVHFLKHNMVIPDKGEPDFRTNQFAGAFVKNPQMGLKKWIMSLDLDSLYPHLMAQYNISPETMISKSKDRVTVDGLIEKVYDTSYLKEKNLCLAANGYHFTTQKQGFLPEILMNMYMGRKADKQKMIEAQKELARINKEMERREQQR